MKLYHSPWACSVAAHMALAESGAPFESESVNLKTKLTASGADFSLVTPKSYVPALELDDGEIVTENIAVLDYIAGRFPQFGLDGTMGRTRLLEALAYVSTEIHKSFKPFWHNDSDERKAAASAYITARMRYLAGTVAGDFLFGDRPSVADYYVLTMVLWAARFSVEVPPALAAIADRLKAMPAVQATLKAEKMI